MRLCALVVCLASLAHADTSVSSPAPAVRGDKVRILATLERGPCYGTCPVYKLTIFSDGRVTWEGRQFVKRTGPATATLTAAELAALRAAFREANYLQLGDGFDCYEATDNPSANTSYDDGSRRKAINHYYGCRSKPEVRTLTALEAKIDQIAKTERWVGTREERKR